MDQIMVKIFLDAGHGGKDSGAIGNDLYEKNIVLDLAKRIEQKLQAYKNVDIKSITEQRRIFIAISTYRYG